MKTLLSLILLIPTLSFSQSTGKVATNKSLRIETIVAADTIWYVEIINMNPCDSRLEVVLRGTLLPDTTTYLQYEAAALFLHSPFEIKARNITECKGGTTDWLTIASTQDAVNCIKNPTYEVKNNPRPFYSFGSCVCCDQVF